MEHSSSWGNILGFEETYSVIFKKFRFASNEDTDLFLIWEKFKFEPNEDADESFIWENFRSASNEDAYPFLI